jgi:hypothetical protein
MRKKSDSYIGHVTEQNHAPDPPPIVLATA